MPAEELISVITDIEWEMFRSVNEGKPKAPCQRDFDTFIAMRRAQFAAWPQSALESYFGDLMEAVASGRNLVSEKYIHMMRATEPSDYERFRVTPPPDAISALALNISGTLLRQAEALRAQYPYISGAGRPLYSTQDSAVETSLETYQLGELLTYSGQTLCALKAYIEEYAASGGSLARDILENTARYYGYAGLSEAEAAADKRAD